MNMPVERIVPRKSKGAAIGALIVAACCLASWRSSARAEEPDAPASSIDPNTAPPKNEAETMGLLDRWSRQTLGGIQLWGDELFFDDWRIQKHVIIGHYRLLDANDLRQTWGTFDTCNRDLERIKIERKLPPMSGRVAILLHGLGGWRGTMQPLGDSLKAHGFKIINVGYPSTRANIAYHGEALRSIVTHLDGVEEIYFVGHSLGNLIIRYYLGTGTKPGLPDPRIKRFVMLAPPNHGAQPAKDFGDSDLFHLVLGDSAVELGDGWDKIEKKLPVPGCEFGIIAGGTGDPKGYLPRLGGDNDGLLTVETTKLVGARDFTIVPVVHPLTMFDATVKEYTDNFLEHGYFISEEKRHPLPPPPPPNPAAPNPPAPAP
jgi:pimeloyl-ACP methyl ester carboxylesterase